MKKFLSALLALSMLACMLAGSVFATGDEDITNKFTDPYFLQAVLNAIDTNSDGRITKAEAEATTVLRLVSDRYDSFDGLEYFTNVETFILNTYTSESSAATSLNVSHMTELTTLICTIDDLTELIVTGCTKLEILDCTFNKLQTLDLSGLSNLTYLNICYNPIASIDISHCPKLDMLVARTTNITELDLSKNTELTALITNYSPIEILDISKNTKIEVLGVAGTNLTSLDISKNPALTAINCNDTQISSLDISRHTNLTSLHCTSTLIPTLDLSRHTKLEYISVGSSALTELKLPDTDTVKGLEFYWDGLTELDLSKYPNLKTFEAKGGQLRVLDLSANSALEMLFYTNGVLEEIIFPQSAPNLFYVQCTNNNLTHLDLNRFNNLVSVSCQGNNIASIANVILPESDDLHPLDYYPQNVEQNDDWNHFLDISKDDWFYDDIKFMITNNLFPQGSGMDFSVPNRSFNPQELITRGQLVESLFAAAGSPYFDESGDWLLCPFEDVYFSQQINATAWAANHGIVKGIDETHFSPETPITRQDLATILVRYAEHMGIALPTDEAASFTDESTISSYALDHVKALASSGIVKGMDDGTFNPQGNVTRAQIAALLHRLLTL